MGAAAPQVPMSDKVPSAKKEVTKRRSLTVTGGGLLILALLVLAISWGWQESITNDIENPDPDDLDPYDPNGLENYLENRADALETAGRVWNFGVILAVIGTLVAAFAPLKDSTW